MDVIEILNRAATCEAAGDEAGAIAAYRQADELGDAEASVLLGQVLRRGGCHDLALEAFARGEARGHREAAMCLGNMLSDVGDVGGAREAFERSIRAGSTMAVLNLGLLLAQEGEVEDALRYLQTARDNGDVEAFWAIGKIREESGDLSAAAESYRGGAEAGDPQAAYGLGVVLHNAGDMAGSKAAFQRASDLGHEGAGTVLEAFAQAEMAHGGAERHGREGPYVARLWEDVSALVPAIAEQRQSVARRWIADQMACEDKHARVAALASAIDERTSQMAKVANDFDSRPDLGKRHSFATPLPDDDPDEWLSRDGSSASWKLSAAQARAFDVDIQQARTAFAKARDKWWAAGSGGPNALSRFALRLKVLVRAWNRARSEAAEAERARDQNASEAGDIAARNLDDLKAASASAVGALPAVLQPWTSDKWQEWTLDDVDAGYRAAFGGYLRAKPDSAIGWNASLGSDVRVPWAMPLHENWYVSSNSNARTATAGFVRSVMLRQLASVGPNELRFCVFDPVGLGQSVGDLLDLGEYNPDVIGGKVWTSPQDLNAQLAEMSSHIELVLQKYLRTTYETIDDFNAAAGEVAEPYRVVVLFDFPAGVTAEATERLKSIVENGPRCGVFTVIAEDSTAEPPYGVDPTHIATPMRRLNLSAGFAEVINGYQLELDFEHDVLPEQSPVAKRVIDVIGRASISRTEAAVTFERTFRLYNDVAERGLKPELGPFAVTTRSTDPGTWWRGDSTRGLFAPIGQKGAMDVAILGFDSADHAGALLVGRPGSGKSTLLHAYIGGLTTLYGPDELEVYLIDFKEGVEFKTYAKHGLPHAKVIAIESDREFGLSVLESLQREISNRGELLRATGGEQAGLQGLREATGDRMPRILLVFDEFQVLFSPNDKLGVASADLLESIVRQGRGFGVHVLLGSQSLAGLDALGSHVLQLLPVRILLPAAEADARRVLGDGNPAGDYLTTLGGGILNSAGGAVEANERFKGALLSEADRSARLQVMREKGDAMGFTRLPMVFEGNALKQLDSQDPRLFREELTVSGSAPVRLRTGVPMTVGEIGDVVLSREMGANVLAIVRDTDSVGAGLEPAGGPAYGLFVTAVASAAMSHSVIDVIDFMSVDDGLDAMLEPLLDRARITLRRRRAFENILDSYCDEVTERVEQDDARREARTLFLIGIHRARELDSDLTSLDADTDLIDKLERIMRDGPEVGVHVWLWSDNVGGAARRMTSRMMREVGWRIAGKMSADDSHTFIGTGQAAELRDSQLIVTNDDRGVSIRMTGFAAPSREWMVDTLETAPRQRAED